MRGIVLAFGFVVVWDWAPSGLHYKVMARTVTGNPSCRVVPGCPATPRLACRQPTVELKGTLALKDRDAGSHDAAVWKWVRGEGTTAGEIGDALTTDSYSLCLYDAANALRAEATLPPGGTCGSKPCWKDLGGKGFKYVDRSGDHGVVRKLVMKRGDEGKAKIIAKLQGDGLTIAPLPPALPLRAQLASTTGFCWEAEFRAEGVTKSSATDFAAKPSLGN